MPSSQHLVFAPSSTTAGDIPVFSGTTGQIQDSGVTINELKSSAQNLLRNGRLLVAQRATSFTAATAFPNNDDVYTFDGFVLVSDGNDIVDLSLTASGTNLGGNYLTCDQETANKQYGFVQIVESNSSNSFRDIPLSFTFSAYKNGGNATAETIRAAIIGWTGTVNAVTSDVVGTWAGAGTDPTLAANWAYITTPQSYTLDSTPRYYTETVSDIGSTYTNVGILVWLDDTDATVGDFIYFGNFAMSSAEGVYPASTTAVSTVPNVAPWKSYAEEHKDAQSYFVIFGSATSGSLARFGSGYFNTTTGCVGMTHYPLMRSAPTATASNTASISVDRPGTSGSTGNTPAFSILDTHSANFTVNADLASTAGFGTCFNIAANQTVSFSSEL